SVTRTVLTGLTTGVIPRYSSTQLTSATSLVSFGSITSVTPSTPPAAILASSGTDQIAEVGGKFSPLRVTVRDRFDNLVSGATVTFASDSASYAGATFPHGNTAFTDASGVASVEVRANFSTGSYQVTASTGGATPGVFNLTN